LLAGYTNDTQNATLEDDCAGGQHDAGQHGFAMADGFADSAINLLLKLFGVWFVCRRDVDRFYRYGVNG
jgi:hypothetical protein